MKNLDTYVAGVVVGSTLANVAPGWEYPAEWAAILLVILIWRRLKGQAAI